METFMSMFNRCFGMMVSREHDSSRNTLVKDQQLPSVTLDTYRMGNDVVIVKNGHRICGSGAALSTAPIHQDKAYFEVKVQQYSEVFGVGIATNKTNLNTVPLGIDKYSWILRGDGSVYHDNKKLYKLPDSIVITEGDIIGVAFDHISLRFYLNNQEIDFVIRGIKGGDESGIYPVVYVDEGAILDAQFHSFHYPPPSGYDRILIEQSLL